MTGLIKVSKIGSKMKWLIVITIYGLRESVGEGLVATFYHPYLHALLRLCLKDREWLKEHVLSMQIEKR